MKNELILVKLGGSLITDKLKPYAIRQDVLTRLAKEIKESGCENLIVGHGSGSFGHQSAHKYQTQRGIVNKDSYKGMSIVHRDAAKLNEIVVNEFLAAGLNAFSLQASAGAKCKKGKITEWNMEPVKIMLKNNILPVPYGDVGFDTAQGCCIMSTEEILSFLAINLKAKRIIIVGKVDGVMTADPSIERGSYLIDEITVDGFSRIKKCLTGSDGVDVTGGMLGKVESMLQLAKKGITSEIINGTKPGNLRKALEGERGLGTLIRK
jgi:isopentenyl phosphate kinase